MVGGRSIRARSNARLRQHALERELGGADREGDPGPGADGGDGAGAGTNAGGQQWPASAAAPMPRLPPMPFSRRGRRRGRGAGAGETGTVLPKLLMKLVVYGVVMVALKYGKQNKEGADSGAIDTRPKPWFIAGVTSVLDVFGGHRGGTALLPGTQTLRVGTSTARNDDTLATVYVVPDFLPQDTAFRWKAGLKYEWHRGTRDSSAFHFSSLPLPSTHESEGSLSTTESMNATAHSARSSGQHSMARWELESVHPLSSEVTRTLSKLDVRNKLLALGMENGADLEEALAMHYSAGDFLYSPDGEVDRTSSHFTVIISLADVKDEVVSTVRFACKPEQTSKQGEGMKWCDTAKLTFNTAVVLTRNKGALPAYDIMPLGLEGHYSIAGTYGLTSAEEAIQEDKEL